MLGVDTNILVRAFLEDDLEQAKKAQAFLKESSEKSKLFISSYAILEFVWVLKTRKFSRSDVYEAVITLTDSPGIMIGQRGVVLAAAEKYLKGKADFGDYMIMSEGEKNNCLYLKTFDQALLNETHLASIPD
jgi:predicted nucleic-acid-binding protein